MCIGRQLGQRSKTIGCSLGYARLYLLFHRQLSKPLERISLREHWAFAYWCKKTDNRLKKSSMRNDCSDAGTNLLWSVWFTPLIYLINYEITIRTISATSSRCISSKCIGKWITGRIDLERHLQSLQFERWLPASDSEITEQRPRQRRSEYGPRENSSSECQRIDINSSPLVQQNCASSRDNSIHWRGGERQ